MRETWVEVLSQLPQLSGVCHPPGWPALRRLASHLTEVLHLAILLLDTLMDLEVTEIDTEKSQTDTGTESGETGGAAEVVAESEDGAGPETEAGITTGTGITTETEGGTGIVTETGLRVLSHRVN